MRPSALGAHAVAKWLSMAMPEELRQERGDAQVVDHCLWEMTVVGFDEETIQAQVEGLERRVDLTHVCTLLMLSACIQCRKSRIRCWPRRTVAARSLGAPTPGAARWQEPAAATRAFRVEGEAVQTRSTQEIGFERHVNTTGGTQDESIPSGCIRHLQ